MQMVEQPAPQIDLPPAKQVFFIKYMLPTATTCLYIIIYAILCFIETHMMTVKVQQNMVDTPNHIDVQVVQWIPFRGIFKILTIDFTVSKILVSTGSPAITMVWQCLHTMASASFGNEILNMTLVSYCITL